jgi:two-component system, OmpR family, sensor histidine kinase CiaH
LFIRQSAGKRRIHLFCMSLNAPKRLRSIFILYWILLTYIIAALVFWFIALTKQNEQATNFKLQELQPAMPQYNQKVLQIRQDEKRKKSQYIGEGITFLLVIVAGAGVVFYLVRRQLQQSQQQQNFMMALTHELKTPIAVAKLNLETLQKRKLEEQQQQRLIQTTLQEANRLNSLCNNMLLSSQIEARGLTMSDEEINISELTASCVGDYMQRFPGKKIITAIATELFTQGDRLLLQMAVNNLLDNAIKYSPKEGAVTVELTAANKWITIKVKDEGKGIEPDEKQRIFTKFYRIGNAATKAAKGTGLGLYLTKKIVQEHNGNIIVTDNTPNGCIFTIALPLMD